MASSSKQTRQITQDIETLKLVPQKNRMMVRPCQTKKITEKKIKTKKNFKINKFFFYSNKKAKKNRAQKKNQKCLYCQNDNLDPLSKEGYFDPS